MGRKQQVCQESGAAGCGGHAGWLWHHTTAAVARGCEALAASAGSADRDQRSPVSSKTKLLFFGTLGAGTPVRTHGEGISGGGWWQDSRAVAEHPHCGAGRTKPCHTETPS